MVIDKGSKGGKVGRVEGRGLPDGDSQALAADCLKERKRKH